MISTSIHGIRKKKKKNPPGTRDKSISNHHPGEKEKIIGQKERKGQPRPTPIYIYIYIYISCDVHVLFNGKVTE